MPCVEEEFGIGGLNRMRNESHFELVQDESPFNIVTLLKDCTARKDLGKGSKLYAYIQHHRCLVKNLHIGSTLVSMYVKCGVLSKAQQVLKQLPVRDVVTWNALIAGYAHQGQVEEVMKFFDDMLHEGHAPTAVTFACVLRACGVIGLATKGEEIHEKIVSLGMLEEDIVLGTALIEMYMKFGALAKAQKVHEELLVHDVVSWSALIVGYTQQEQGGKALKCFDDMLHEGQSPDAVTFACVLKACGSIGAAAKGKEIHDQIVSLGGLDKDMVLGISLVDMYVKCGALPRAQQVLKELPVREVDTWNTLLAGYAEQGQGEETLKCFSDLLHDGHSPTAATFVCILKACGIIRSAAKGEEIHEKIVSLSMLEKDIMLGTTLVDMYTKCCALHKAQQVLKKLPVRNVVTWNALIAGYARQGQGKEALKCFDDMLREGHYPSAVTFACVLKACGSIGAAVKGKEIHDNIVCLGLLEKDIVLGTTLVEMYVKCGALLKAQQVHEELPVRNVITWNALIAGYAQQRQGEEALKCFNCMLYEGHSSTAVTFAYVLKACGSIGATAKGKEIHDKVVVSGMLEKNAVLGTALVDMYAKCGAIAKAQQVHEEVTVHDVISWMALIAGYAEQEQGDKVLECFDEMLCEGHTPSPGTIACALKVCGRIGAAAKGKEIHDMIISLGMLEENILVRTTLVDMYAKCGSLAKVQQLLQEVPVCDVPWDTLIGGYAEQGQGKEALQCFDGMLCEGHSPSVITFIRVLKTCGSIRAPAIGEEIHDKIANLGMLEKDIVLGTTLMGMYVKCGALAKAQQVHEELPIHDVVSWNALMAGYAGQGKGEKALKCFDHLLQEGHSPTAVTFVCVLRVCGRNRQIAKGEELHEKVLSSSMLQKDIVLGSSLVDMYVRCGALAKAERVFEKLPVCDVVSWSVLIAGYAQHGKAEEALNCFNDMLHEGHSPDAVTFACVLKVCGSIRAASQGKEIHENIVSLGMLKKDVLLGTTLVDMYANCGALTLAQKVLEELPARDVVSWSSLIAGYAEQGQGEEALQCFDSMLHDGHSPTAVTFIYVLKACGRTLEITKGEGIHDKIVSMGMLERDIVLGTALMDMYSKCGSLAKARQVHEELPACDVVSWNTLIAGYAEHGQAEEALKCYDSMLQEGHSPTVVTFLCVLNSCGDIGAVAKGKDIHDIMVNLGMLERHIVLGNSLVGMYSKCGAFMKAKQVFEELPVCDVVSWTALISGYAKGGQSVEAVNCFQRMLSDGVLPNSITLTSLLSACSHSGVLDLAEVFFLGMSTKYGIHPDLEHYCCMADLFGRAGEFGNTLSIIVEMPYNQCLSSWVALLGACHKWGDVKIGELAFKHALQLDRSNTAVYVLMADIYTASGMQEDAYKIAVMSDK